MKKLFAFMLSLFTLTAAFAWPTKEINIILPYTLGGLSDRILRIMQVDLTNSLGVPVHIKSMPGAGNMVAITHIDSKPNDDHTFIFTLQEDFILGPMYQNNPIYNKFRPIILIGTIPYMLVGGNTASISKFKQQINNKATVNVGVVGLNGGAHLWISNIVAPLTINSIPYKGSAPLVTDVIGSHTEYGTISLTAAHKLVQSGQLVPIMQSGKQRSVLYPDVPTVNELGLTDPLELYVGFTIISRIDTDSNAEKIFSSAIRSIIANNPQIRALSLEGMNLVNLDMDESLKTYKQQIQRYEKIKNK